MADYFFTDPDLLLNQDSKRIADGFGYVKATQNKFSVTSLHRGRAIPFLDPEDSSKIDERGPDAFAVLDGEVLAFEITNPPPGDSGNRVVERYNVVLKPSVQNKHSAQGRCYNPSPLSCV